MLPFEITSDCIRLLADVERLLGRHEGRHEGRHQPRPAPQLRKSLRVRSVQSSVAIEGNTLTEEQITALLDGRRVVGPQREILEAQNALVAYDRLPDWNPAERDDLLSAHGILMSGLIDRAGKWRRGGVGVLQGTRVAHVAPPANRVAFLVGEVLDFLRDDTATHPAVKAAVIHYELEFIHPFEDGNGRIGRLWHTLILGRYHPVFGHVPIESIIRERQSDYYEVLRDCDQKGSSTAFVEFSLQATHEALQRTLSELAPSPVTPSQRLETAAEHFQSRNFSRKDYMTLFPNLSTATSSRDLRKAVDESRLKSSGERAQTVYQFRPSARG
ncbi:MAG: Fic family protein [Planctomycetota bacterium]|nr:Fic family protein [Planctomycetota bacterium]MDA1252831.1 Fic family protein [Planctomycetota bacterium]